MTHGVVANLDVEARCAGETLPVGVLRRLAAAGSLLRVFCEQDDDLWLPGPVDSGRVADVPGLPRPALASSGEPPVSATRHMWCARASEPLLSREVGLELAVDLGRALPGARIWGAEATNSTCGPPLPGAWVLKPRHSAAGRGQRRGHGEELLGGGSLAELAASGPWLLEPWLDRVADFGCVGTVREDGSPELLGMHRLLVSPGGRFQGLELELGSRLAPGLLPEEARCLGSVALEAGVWLAARGHRGVYGLDAYRHRGAQGVLRFHPLGEVNARTTFGWVARRLMERVGLTAGWRAGDLVRLRFGSGALPGAADLPLLYPAASASPGGDDTAAWFERSGS